MDKYAWKPVDKLDIFFSPRARVDKSQNPGWISTVYPQETRLVFRLFLQGLKKKVDHLSPYAQCLLLVLQ